jgi:hypothetical protein
MDTQQLLNWHTDGHEIAFRLHDAEVVATAVPCPYQVLDDVACKVRGVCIFEYFVNIFGTELNVGQVDMAPKVEFAWALQGDDYDFDAMQLWIIPVDDPTFGSWAAAYE